MKARLRQLSPDTPEIRDIVNITPDTIFVTGLCQEGATVTITGGTEDVVVESLNGYFVAEVGLINTTSTLFEAVASVEVKDYRCPSYRPPKERKKQDAKKTE